MPTNSHEALPRNRARSRTAVRATCLVALLASTPARAVPLPAPTTVLPEDPPAWVVRDATMRAATDLALSPDGSTVYIASLSKVPGSSNGSPTVSAYDAATGERRWRFSSRSSGTPTHGGPRLALSPDGVRIYLHGTILHGSVPNRNWLDSDIATWALKAGNGDNLWYQRYDGPPRLGDAGTDVITTDDLVIATGVTARHQMGQPAGVLWLRAYGPGNGRLRWTRTYSSRKDPATSYDATWDIGVALASANGGDTVVATGSSNYSGDPIHVILTLAVASATGSVKWIRRATHPEPEDGRQGGSAVAVDRGRAFVAGFSDEYEGSAESRPVALAHRLRDGRREWIRPYAPGQGTTGSASAVVVHPASGAPIFAGPVSHPFRLWSLFPATGALRWESPDVGPGVAIGAIMDPSGSIVYGAGSIEGDAVVIGYNPTDGSALWRGTHAEDEATRALVVKASPDHVFIGGTAGPQQDLLVAAFGAP